MPSIDAILSARAAVSAANGAQTEFRLSEIAGQVADSESAQTTFRQQELATQLSGAESAQTSFRQSEIAAQNASSARELNGRIMPTSSTSGSMTSQPVGGQSKDMRVRLRAQDQMANQVYGPPNTNGDTNILNILHSTNGMLFPYTPSIEWSQAVEYKSLSMTHSNQDFFSYHHTPSTSISVNGDFTVQNYREAQYMIAVMHYLRVVSKMFFGKPAAGYPSGMPPPVLIFSGYGNFMFNDLPVIVKNHSYSLGKDIDYIDVDVAGGRVRLPTMLSISMNLTVQNTPKQNREEFNLNKFRTGELMTKKKGWI